MALFPKETTLNWVLRFLNKQSAVSRVEIQSYKRNRSIKVLKKEAKFQIIENGFWKEEFIVERNELKTILKKLIRREFPRSHKLWVFKQVSQ